MRAGWKDKTEQPAHSTHTPEMFALRALAHWSYTNVDACGCSLRLCAYICCACLGLFSLSIRPRSDCIVLVFCSGMPPIMDHTEAQHRGLVHAHILLWRADINGSAPSTRATHGSDEHSTSSASTRAYVAGYCTRGEPAQTKHRRGGETSGAQKTTQEDSA